nr:MAG TPA: hypothetical protein [Caudoviricetes sp.]
MIISRIKSMMVFINCRMAVIKRIVLVVRS